jgi:hypothetical protein
MEVTKWLKPSISVSRIGDNASVQAVTRVNAEQALYGAFFVKEFARAANLLSFVSFFVRSQARFFVPTRGSLTSSRAGAVKVGRRANLAACSEIARPYLDSFEHDGTLGAVGMTIREEPAFGRGSIAPQPCIRWVQGPEP